MVYHDGYVLCAAGDPGEDHVCQCPEGPEGWRGGSADRQRPAGAGADRIRRHGGRGVREKRVCDGPKRSPRPAVRRGRRPKKGTDGVHPSLFFQRGREPMRPTGKMAAAAAVALAQSYHSYQEMDCQALIEQAVRNVGGQMDYRGSNDMARSAAWLGTLENARAEGKLVPGALLFIHEDDESGLPAQYQGDGLGDFSHVGLYVGETFVHP
uniref:NlpC/P60 domain-containing protein n=2 Tax=unclassified Caudoviricetes TaxID=2788787 RepID=A0A8S5M3P3_9CAUD|nr:MAG TPA: protein of unknown function (DUF1287) [Siphoviridae sp. ctQJR51]DAF96527.1 MAG TPA: protein of unknown function (DUF1287) [Siphoviridae sp. ctHj524]